MSWFKGLTNPFKKPPMEGYLVADLDKMVTDTVTFRWRGKVHKLKPINTQEFLRVSEGMARLDELRRAKKVTQKEMIEAYGFLIESVCDSIKTKDINDMTQSQLAAIYQLIMDSVTGRAFGQKKTLKFVEEPTEAQTLLEQARVR